MQVKGWRNCDRAAGYINPFLELQAESSFKLCNIAQRMSGGVPISPSQLAGRLCTFHLRHANNAPSQCNVASSTRLTIGMASPFTHNPQYVVRAGKWDAAYRVLLNSRSAALCLFGIDSNVARISARGLCRWCHLYTLARLGVVSLQQGVNKPWCIGAGEDLSDRVCGMPCLIYNGPRTSMMMSLTWIWVLRESSLLERYKQRLRAYFLFLAALVLLAVIPIPIPHTPIYPATQPTS